MRYCIVTETYPPEVNGVALTVQSLERGLRERGHQVDVVRPRQSPAQLPEAHETLVTSAQIPKYPGMRFGFPANRLLRRRWREKRPDAIYVATEGPLGWSAMRVAAQLGIPSSSGFHTRFDEYMRDYGVGFLQPLAVRWMRRFHNTSAATIVPTCELMEFLQGLGFDQVTHMPRAVDTALFDPARRNDALRAEWGLGPDDLAVIYVGRVAAEKNLPLAVRAFRELQKQRPDAKFVWVGEGPELAGIARDNPDFVIRGVQRGEDCARHFASADLFLFPSHSETFGNVTIEAMASGVPTVAFHYGAAREHLKDGLHGASIRGRDDDAFIRAACRIALDDAARREMGRNAREAISRLRPEQVAADFDDILQRIVGAEVNPYARAA
ncbi:glycosyltransferase family 1 protein [Lysobacter pythonis]|uniref:Glycosyltransferase family 1 protein n=1 Tax=Solilutibacter pythonis TaxID=2483112 RepID=A0A3M2I5E7_9GAMM|nr:glycosyltransferase family 1 protein [Lysobacter pythonis]RMH94462.1 glycosyltransferase family 1 protein [Lysobacter pythonis]